MANRADELKNTAAQCLALAQATTDPQARAALLTMAQKLYDMASNRPGHYEAAQREFNQQQMLPQRQKLLACRRRRGRRAKAWAAGHARHASELRSRLKRNGNQHRQKRKGPAECHGVSSSPRPPSRPRTILPPIY